jgi:hypothetical protein
MTLPYDEPVPYIPNIPPAVDETLGYPSGDPIDQSGVYGDSQQAQAKTDADTRNTERSQEGETGSLLAAEAQSQDPPSDPQTPPDAPETPA